MLDIIIPQYKETDEIIKFLLDSINNQINVNLNDINITIVNDGSNVYISDKLLNSYSNLNINYIKNKENNGPGVTRQIGLDNTNDNYIMFMDADDALASNIALYVIMSCINDVKPDLIITNIVNERNNNYLIKKGKDTLPWLHGKVYKREILNRYNIKFHNKLRYFEDSYFTICYMSNIKDDDLITLDFNCYLWKNNNNSITRKERKYGYTVEEFDDFFYCPIYAYDFIKNTNYPYVNEYMIKATCGLHQILNSNLFNYAELNEKREFFNNELIKFISNNKQIFKGLTKENLKKHYDDEYEALLKRDTFEIINGIDSLAKLLNIK